MIDFDELSFPEIDAMILNGKISRKAVADHFGIAYQAFLRYWNRTTSIKEVIELDETVAFRTGPEPKQWTIGNVTGTAKGWANVLGCTDRTFIKIVKLFPPGSKEIYNYEFKGTKVWGGTKEWTQMKDIERNPHLLDGPGTWEKQWI